MKVDWFSKLAPWVQIHVHTHRGHILKCSCTIFSFHSRTILHWPRTKNDIVLASVLYLTHRWHHFCQFTRKQCKPGAIMKAILFHVWNRSKAASVGELCLSSFWERRQKDDDENGCFDQLFSCLPHTHRYICEYYSGSLSSITLYWASFQFDSVWPYHTGTSQWQNQKFPLPSLNREPILHSDICRLRGILNLSTFHCKT